MDRKDFIEKYESVYRDMYRYAYLTLGRKVDAEDAVSDAVVDAYRAIGSLKDPDAFRGWIFRILSRKCIAKKKIYATEKTVSIDELAEEDGVGLAEKIPDKMSAQMDEKSVITQLFRGLDDIDQSIIALHLFGGYTSSEIGGILGMNDSTVRSRERRALERLRGEYNG